MKAKARNILKLTLSFLLLGGVIGALVSLSKIDSDTPSSENPTTSQITSELQKEEILKSLNYKYYVQYGLEEDSELYSIRALFGISNETYVRDIKVTTYLKCNDEFVEAKNMISTILYNEIRSGDGTISAKSLGHEYFLILSQFDELEADTYTIQSEIYSNDVLISITEIKTLQIS